MKLSGGIFFENKRKKNLKLNLVLVLVIVFRSKTRSALCTWQSDNILWGLHGASMEEFFKKNSDSTLIYSFPVALAELFDELIRLQNSIFRFAGATHL